MKAQEMLAVVLCHCLAAIVMCVIADVMFDGGFFWTGTAALMSAGVFTFMLLLYLHSKEIE
jgi:uncharacterized membrane protein